MARVRVLLVDDDRDLRMLLRTTFESLEVAVDEADSIAAAERAIAEHPPDVILLDVRMPGGDGVALSRRLKAAEATRMLPIVLLTGVDTDELPDDQGQADVVVAKPFSPLEVLAVAERLAGGLRAVPIRPRLDDDPKDQLLLYARDLRHLLAVERGQRRAVENAYRETISALAAALEQKDGRTRAHSRRVQRYALELAKAVAPDVADDSSAEYGFLLHDVGKIGIPDRILQKPGPLTSSERRVIETHTVLGEQLLLHISLLQGEGLRIVRSHHERWDGHGYPDGLGEDEIPVGARVFALADTLDAMTSNRPYRRGGSWENAKTEIVGERGKQFWPDVVDAFREREGDLRRMRRELAAA